MRPPALSASPGTLLVSRMESMPEYHRLLSHEYFRGLSGGGMSRAGFTASQRQFYFAVRFFSRPMAALMARMPDSACRQGLIHNLAEEHGFEDEEGPASFNPGMAHDLTIRQFLGTLGVSPGVMLEEREGPAVRAFNLSLLGACMMEPPPFAFAGLGAIEYAFAEISALIGKVVVERGWIPLEELAHYKLHAEIDKRHAADFFVAVEKDYTKGGTARRQVVDGLEFGLFIFHQLYTGLHRTADGLES